MRGAAMALTAIILAALYVPVFGRLVDVWRTDTYAAHGLLVMPFSAWAAFSVRECLRQISRSSRWEGWLVILAGLGVLGAGRMLESVALQATSVPLVVTGWVLLAFGPGYLPALAFPIGFLVFLAPLPRPVVAALSGHLQSFAAWFGAGTAGLFGVPVYQENTFVFLPSMTLQIAEICNGMRFMTALVVLAVALGHTVGLGPLRQAILAGCAIVLAIVANATRVAAIVLGVHFYGPEAASGLIHHLIGKVFWALTLVPLALAAWALRPRPPIVTSPSPSLPGGGTRV